MPLLLAFLCLLTLPLRSAHSQPVVEVAREYRAIHHVAQTVVTRGSFVPFDLRPNKYGDRYWLMLGPSSVRMMLLVIDGQDRAKSNLQPTPLLKRAISGGEGVLLPASPTAEGLIVLIQNEGSTDVKLLVRIDRVGPRPDEVLRQVRDWVAGPFESMDAAFRLPRIKVQVRPCGEVNAFSSPDITVCTELIADLSERGLIHALYPILLHELAHSLLNIWGLPGFNNEDVADEFAAVFAPIIEPEGIPHFVKWLQARNPVTEAVVQIIEGGRHTISIQ